MKVHAEGYKNISVVGLAGVLFLVVSLWILTLETKEGIVLLWFYTHVISPLIVRWWNCVKAIWSRQRRHSFMD